MKFLHFILLIIFSLLSQSLSLNLVSPNDLISPNDHDGSSSNGPYSSKILLPTTRPDLAKAGEERDFILMNRHPVHLTNRFPFPRVLRFFPHRCHHHHNRQTEQRFFEFPQQERRFKWGPGRPREMDENENENDVVGLMFRKKNQGGGPFAEIIRKRHVAREANKNNPSVFPDVVDKTEAMVMFGEFKGPHFHHPILVPRQRVYRHHDHHHYHRGGNHDDVEDQTVVMKREKKEDVAGGDRDEVDREMEKEMKEEVHRHHHEERENGLINKIRKFLVQF